MNLKGGRRGKNKRQACSPYCRVRCIPLGGCRFYQSGLIHKRYKKYARTHQTAPKEPSVTTGTRTSSSLCSSLVTLNSKRRSHSVTTPSIIHAPCLLGFLSSFDPTRRLRRALRVIGTLIRFRKMQNNRPLITRRVVTRGR